MDAPACASSLRKIVFFHLPKTGGTSLHELLACNFSTDHVCPARFDDDLAELSDEHLQQYHYFFGHFTRPTLQRPHFANAIKICILRNPVERALSNYNFWRAHKTEYLRQNGMHLVELTKQTALHEFFSPTGPLGPVACDGMTRALCESGDADEFNRRTPEATALEAIAYLATFDHVLITEFLDLQVPDVLSSLGFDVPSSIPWRRERRFNRLEHPHAIENVEPAEYDCETRQRAATANRADFLVYRHFLDRFLSARGQSVAQAYHEARRNESALQLKQYYSRQRWISPAVAAARFAHRGMRKVMGN